MSGAGGQPIGAVWTTGTCAECGDFPVAGWLLRTVDERTELVAGHACKRKRPVPKRPGERPH
ncbi:hypothetical protein GCM10010505_62240 [Kitasatospora aburaviensis]